MTPAVPLEIDVNSVAALRSSGEQFLLLDVREPDEFEIAKIADAQLIPMQQIPARLAELEPYRHQRIVVQCHHGGRSLRVTHYLRGQGFDQAQNLSGGIDAWSVAIDPSVPRY
jgi:rhodanese-related sulfurtransferase